MKNQQKMQNNNIDLYSAKSGVNYSDYVEYINSFEIKTKKLVDNLKMKIEMKIKIIKIKLYSF
jgi:Holliday junction resolvase RusA-like endonuclease